jgi:hypothetical protein
VRRNLAGFGHLGVEHSRVGIQVFAFRGGERCGSLKSVSEDAGPFAELTL